MSLLLPKPSAVVSKLSDKNILRNYCTFSALHRAKMAVWCFRALESVTNEHDQRSLGLQILAEYVASLEDVALWVHVLREWRPGQALLFDKLDEVEVNDRPGHQYSTEKALHLLDQWDVGQFCRELGLPDDSALREAGLSDEQVRRYFESLGEIHRCFKDALQFRGEEERILVSCFNKVKHGMLAIAATEASASGVSVMLSSRKGPRNPSTGQRKINTGWLPCEPGELRKIVNSLLFFSRALWELASLTYWFHFDRDWTPPEWPYQLV